MLFIIGLLKVVLVIVCILIVLLVLMQRPKQEGLGAAFAQGMMNEIGGAHTANILQKGTTYLGVMFFTISLLLSVLISAEARSSRTPYGDPSEIKPGEVAGGGEGEEKPMTAGEPTLPLDFKPPLIPGVDTPLGGITPEEGTGPEGGGTVPGVHPETPDTPAAGGSSDGGEAVDPGAPAEVKPPAVPETPEANGGAAGDSETTTAPPASSGEEDGSSPSRPE